MSVLIVINLATESISILADWYAHTHTHPFHHDDRSVSGKIIIIINQTHFHWLSSYLFIIFTYSILLVNSIGMMVGSIAKCCVSRCVHIVTKAQTELKKGKGNEFRPV